MFYRCLLAGFSALLLFAPAALAQTSDEQPPPEESVCDPLKDGTPGLYGLCNSYCEAIDCVGSVQDDPWSCSSILNNYNYKRQPGDPTMPCLPACPCFDEAFIMTELETVRTCGPSRAAGVDANVCSASVSVTFGTSTTCNSANRNVNALGGCSLVSLVTHPLTEAQALTCMTLIQTVCP
jgi:hypothetical protein